MNKWERSLIDHPVFQRLRRIRQLAWTDYVYPGAMHTRFEHSIGVMHVATLLYDSILQNSMSVLSETYGEADGHVAWKERERQKVRLAALLHDVGHSPFSHASEDLFPFQGSDGSGNTQLTLSGFEKKRKRYKHEDYSIALIKHELRSAIEDDDFNKQNFRISCDEVTNLLRGDPEAGPTLFWREILSNQLDADRMDYLLRDSHHLGVSYGRYDLHRLVSSVCAYPLTRPDDDESRLGIGVLKGGLHAAESLIAARYSMFKQVYFHKTRMAYDIHLQHSMATILPNGIYPPPTEMGLKDYLRWDDWKVQGYLADGLGGAHAARMLDRKHFRLVYSSKDRLLQAKQKKGALNLVLQERRKLDAVKHALGPLLAAEKKSRNSWYKSDLGVDIPIIDDSNCSKVLPLSQYSAMAELNAEDQYYLYAEPENAKEARKIVIDAQEKFDREQNEKQKNVLEKRSKLGKHKKTLHATKYSASVSTNKKGVKSQSTVMGEENANAR